MISPQSSCTVTVVVEVEVITEVAELTPSEVAEVPATPTTPFLRPLMALGLAMDRLGLSTL